MKKCAFFLILGLEPKGVVATTETTFTVETHSAGDGDLKVVIKGPKGEIPCEIRDNGDGTFTCVYSAPVAGRYTITITWAGKTIPRSPFKIDVSPYVDITKIKAYGPGLERGMTIICLEVFCYIFIQTTRMHTSSCRWYCKKDIDDHGSVK